MTDKTPKDPEELLESSAPAEEQAKIKEGSPKARPYRASKWLGFGFFVFGLTAGTIGGMSVAPGSGLSLLTSVFSFAAGSVLTFAGYRKSSDTPDPRSLGQGLVGFSFGTLAGVLFGAALRLGLIIPHSDSHSTPAPSNAPPASASATPVAPRDPAGRSLNLQNDVAKTCGQVSSALSAGAYTSDEGPLKHHLVNLKEEACSAESSSKICGIVDEMVKSNFTGADKQAQAFYLGQLYQWSCER